MSAGVKRRYASIGRILHSRRTAVWLLVAVGAYSVVGTIVPQAGREPQRVAMWAERYPIADSVCSALGLYHAYSHPLFLLALAFLAISTVACAWERTLWGVRRLAGSGKVTRAELQALRDRPSVRVALTHGADPALALEAAGAALRDVRMRVRSGPKVVEATAGRWGVFGSPLFHWGLALLFVVVGLGRLSRSEGLMGIPVGSSKQDVSASYGLLEEGPLFRGHTALDIGVRDLVADFATPDGVSRGPAPIVSLARDGATVAERRVYPNAPLRYGTTMIHMDDTGYAVGISLDATAGAAVAQQTLLVDRRDGESTRTTPAGFALTDQAGNTAVELEAWLEGTAEDPVLVLDVLEPSFLGLPQRYRAALGEVATLPTGDRIRFVSLGDYVRLSVVHDWSVLPMYVLLAITGVGISVAVLDPYRRVLVSVESSEEGPPSLHALIRHGRSSALFEERIADALERAAAEADLRGGNHSG